MAFLHEHRRRVPTQNVDRSIVVGMDAESASATDKDRLAFAAPPVHGSAGRTGLRGMARVDLAKVSTPLLKFVGKHSLESVPALIEDSTVQACLLADILAGCVYRSLGAARHIARGEIFQNHSSEATGDVEAGTMPPVLPYARCTSLQTRYAATGLRMAYRPALAARGQSLCPALLVLDCRKAGGHV